eukprot:6195865-Pleurochrysis_carterae.AAC.1
MPSKKKEEDEESDVSSVEVDEEEEEEELDEEAANDLSNSDIVTKYRCAGDIANRVLGELIKAMEPGKKAVDLCTLGDKLIADATDKVYNQKKKGKKIEKGSAFPTCVSVNNCVGHYSPLTSEDKVVLAEVRARLENSLASECGRRGVGPLGVACPWPRAPVCVRLRQRLRLSPRAAADAVRVPVGVSVQGDVVKVDLGVHVDGYIAVLAHSAVVGGAEAVEGRKADVMMAAWTAAELAQRMFKEGATNAEITAMIAKARPRAA